MRRRSVGFGDTPEDAWMIARDALEEKKPGYQERVSQIVKQGKDLLNAEDIKTGRKGVPRDLLPYDLERDPRIKVTYDRITPESAEEGDLSESGWLDEDGQSMLPADEDETVVDRAVGFLLSEGVNESSGDFSPGTWYMTPWEIISYSTGEEEQKAYHLYEFTDDEEKSIFMALKAKRYVR
jgi:hypothetical protein